MAAIDTHQGSPRRAWKNCSAARARLADHPDCQSAPGSRIGSTSSGCAAHGGTLLQFAPAIHQKVMALTSDGTPTAPAGAMSSTTARAPAGRRRTPPSVACSGCCLHRAVDRAHAPGQVQAAGRLGNAGAIGQDRTARAEGRQALRGDPRPGGDDDGGGVEIVCQGGGRVRQRVGHLRAGRPFVQRQQRLGLDQKADHHVDGARRIVTDRGLLGQHDRVGAIEHRVGHVRGLGAGGLRVAGHAVEHLSGRDDRPPRAVGGADDPLLRGRHSLDRDLHPQIAARHHDRVGGRDDGIEPLQRLLLLDLGHQRQLGERPRLRDVALVAHVRDGDEIGPEDVQVGEIRPVLVGQRGERRIIAREVISLRR